MERAVSQFTRFGYKFTLIRGTIGTADFVSKQQAAPLVAVFGKTPSHFLDAKFLLLLASSVLFFLTKITQPAF